MRQPHPAAVAAPGAGQGRARTSVPRDRRLDVLPPRRSKCASTACSSPTRSKSGNASWLHGRCHAWSPRPEIIPRGRSDAAAFGDRRAAAVGVASGSYNQARCARLVLLVLLALVWEDLARGGSTTRCWSRPSARPSTAFCDGDRSGELPGERCGLAQACCSRATSLGIALAAAAHRRRRSPRASAPICSRR